MNISICTTTFNEEKSIAKLLDSLLNQTLKPIDIIIVDGGSTDKTVEIIRHYQKKDNRIKLLVEKCSRSRGRNLGIEIAKSEIVAMTDAGCVAKPNWLKNLIQPFVNEQVGVSAGFYIMTGETNLQKAQSVFLGVSPSKFDINFLPSTRSIAFRKSVWEEIGGFSENIDGAAEDTVFNYKLIKNNIKIAHAKNAIVEWEMPKTIFDFYSKIYNYAKGDAKSKIWNFPGKGIASHNIKSLFILLRYVLGIILLMFSIKYLALLVLLLLLVILYMFWAFRKAGPWGPILQIVCDCGVIRGFLSGMWGFDRV